MSLSYLSIKESRQSPLVCRFHDVKATSHDRPESCFIISGGGVTMTLSEAKKFHSAHSWIGNEVTLSSNDAANLGSFQRHNAKLVRCFDTSYCRTEPTTVTANTANVAQLTFANLASISIGSGETLILEKNNSDVVVANANNAVVSVGIAYRA